MGHETFEILTLAVSGMGAIVLFLFSFVLSGIRSNQASLWHEVNEQGKELATLTGRVNSITR